jgi:hypothetical protein
MNCFYKQGQVEALQRLGLLKAAQTPPPKPPPPPPPQPAPQPPVIGGGNRGTVNALKREGVFL